MALIFQYWNIYIFHSSSCFIFIAEIPYYVNKNCATTGFEPVKRSHHIEKWRFVSNANARSYWWWPDFLYVNYYHELPILCSLEQNKFCTVHVCEKPIDHDTIVFNCYGEFFHLYFWSIECGTRNLTTFLAAIDIYTQIATIEGVIIQSSPFLHVRLLLVISVPDLGNFYPCNIKSDACDYEICTIHKASLPQITFPIYSFLWLLNEMRLNFFFLL